VGPEDQYDYGLVGHKEDIGVEMRWFLFSRSIISVVIVGLGSVEFWEYDDINKCSISSEHSKVCE
jgi:hypothetical protein